MADSLPNRVSFFYEQPVSFQKRTKLKVFIQALFRKEKVKLESLNYIFCSDQRLLEINKQFLRHDYYTDIITFELSEKGSPISGEIYISVDRVRDNAINHDEPFNREFHRVVFHGALHLCGYGDKTNAEKLLMRAREDYYLNLYL